MRKIFVLLLVALLFIGSGCITDKPKPNPKPSKIIVKMVVEEGAASMSEIKAMDSMSFTITRGIMTLPCSDWVTGKTTKIEAYLYDDQGNLIETPIQVTKPEIVPPYADCWRFLSQNDPETTGAYGDFMADVPGGIGLARLSAMGIDLDLPLLVYPTWKNLSQNTGIAPGPGTVPGGSNTFHVSSAQLECFLWNDSTDLKKVILKGKSYYAGDQPNHWFDCQNFVDIKTVDQDLIDAGDTDRVIEYNKIYVFEVNGIYGKLFYSNTWPQDFMRVVIFEISTDGTFL